MKNLILRTLTGVVYVAAIIGCILGGQWPFVLLFSLVVALSVNEFIGLMNRHAAATIDTYLPAIAGVYLLLAMMLGNAHGMLPVYFLLVALIPVFELFRAEPNPLRNWSLAFASQLYIALPFAQLALIHRSSAIPLALFVFIFLWVSDTGAYLVGSQLGRFFPAKLFARVSPGKTWVGSVGGFVLCLVAAAISFHFYPEIGLPLWMGFAACVCVFGTIGDLVESQLKRHLGIKDSGNILPGHGGMLDRFDSALIAIPASYCYLTLAGVI